MTPPGPLSHIALVVRDAKRTAGFLAALFGDQIKVQPGVDESDEVCVRLGNVLLVLAEADVERSLLGDHIAFRVSSDRLRLYAEKLKALGHSHQMARRNTALYFSDFDNHVFELECGGLDPQQPTDQRS